MNEETRTYHVYLEHRVSTVVEVEASSIEQARDLARDQAPAPTNVSNDGIDESGDWEDLVVYLDDEEVWTSHTGETSDA